MKIRSRLQFEKELYTYVILLEAGMYALEAAKKSQEDEGKESFFLCLTAMLYSAFCLEAYLNHLGEAKIGSSWEELERKLSPREKLTILAEKIGYKVDYGKPPFQTFINIFHFRNKVVHGRTEDIKQETILEYDYEGHPELPPSELEKQVNLNKSQRFIEDSIEIMELLHQQAGFQQHPLSTPSKATWTASPVPKDK